MTDCERYKAALVCIAHPPKGVGRQIYGGKSDGWTWDDDACRDIALEALEPFDPDDFVPAMIGAYGRRPR